MKLADHLECKNHPPRRVLGSENKQTVGKKKLSKVALGKIKREIKREADLNARAWKPPAVVSLSSKGTTNRILQDPRNW